LFLIVGDCGEQAQPGKWLGRLVEKGSLAAVMGDHHHPHHHHHQQPPHYQHQHSAPICSVTGVGGGGDDGVQERKGRFKIKQVGWNSSSTYREYPVNPWHPLPT